jgi:hypothetical protein
VCEDERKERMRVIEEGMLEIRFEPGKWRWRYQGGR